MEQTSLLSQSVWLELPKATRTKIASVFNFPEKGNVQTMYGPHGPVVLNDGYGYDALKLVTLERMQELTGSQSDNFYHLFKKIVLLVNEEGVQFYEDRGLTKEEGEAIIKIAREKGKSDDKVILTEEEILVNIKGEKLDPEILTKETPTKKKFCDSCDSKGRFHKKDCPNKEQKHAKTA